MMSQMKMSRPVMKRKEERRMRRKGIWPLLMKVMVMMVVIVALMR